MGVAKSKGPGVLGLVESSLEGDCPSGKKQVLEAFKQSEFELRVPAKQVKESWHLRKADKFKSG